MFSNRLQKLQPYKPGEQPKDRVYIKLNANENPYPPSPKVSEALKKIPYEKLGLYPDPDSNELKDAIASLLNKTNGVFESSSKSKLPLEVTRDMIFCGNGSDEVLSFVFYAFFDNEAPLVSPEFSYSFYPVYAGYYGIQLKKIPLLPDFSLDIKSMLSEKSCGMIFANPNAPTGIALSVDQIRDMLVKYPKDKVFVVDEAYTDFSGTTVLPLLAEFKNLLIVRTFSKSMSFAGMRLGYVIANPELINALITVKNSFNHFPNDFVCQTAGIAACSDVDWYAENCRKIMQTRDRFSAELRSMNWKILPSATNFVLAAKPGVGGNEVYRKIKEKGILVRYFDIDTIRDFVRITIGTAEQMDKLLEIMKEI